MTERKIVTLYQTIWQRNSIELRFCYCHWQSQEDRVMAHKTINHPLAFRVSTVWTNDELLSGRNLDASNMADHKSAPIYTKTSVEIYSWFNWTMSILIFRYVLSVLETSKKSLLSYDLYFGDQRISSENKLSGKI